MNYVPIIIMLKALHAKGWSDRRIGEAIGLNASNVCRLRIGEYKDTTSSVYFTLYALWKDQVGGTNAAR